MTSDQRDRKKSAKAKAKAARARKSRDAVARYFASGTSKEVARLTSQGLTTSQIARRLGIDEAVVRRHQHARGQVRSTTNTSANEPVGRIRGSVGKRQGAGKRRARKIRRRSPHSPFQATAFQGERGPWMLSIPGQTVPWRIRLYHRSGDLAIESLAGRRLLYDLKGREGDTLIVMPRLSRNVSKAKRTESFRHPDLHELVASGRLEQALERIEILMRKDDPDAWDELIKAHAHSAIREPVEAALRGVGVEKALNRVRRDPGEGWTAEVIEFLIRETAAAKPAGPVTRANLPHETSGFDRPYWSDD